MKYKAQKDAIVKEVDILGAVCVSIAGGQVQSQLVL